MNYDDHDNDMQIDHVRNVTHYIRMCIQNWFGKMKEPEISPHFPSGDRNSSFEII